MRTIPLSAAMIACALALSPSLAAAMPSNGNKQAISPWLELRTALAGEDLWPGNAVTQAARPRAETALAEGPSDHSLKSKTKGLTRGMSNHPKALPLRGIAKIPADREN